MKKVYVAKSTIEGAGKGLFAKVDIQKGEVIGEYKGEVITDEEYDRRTQEGLGNYGVDIGDGLILDCGQKMCPMGYANDAYGLKRVGKNNSYFIQDELRVFVVALRDIKAGEEIFVSYGRAYWKAQRENN